MVAIGFGFNDGDGGDVSEVCWKSNHRTNQDNSCQSDFRSTVEYAAVTWLPLVSILTMVMVEICQKYAGRAITGQIKTTPVKVILAEADLPPVAAWATQLIPPCHMWATPPCHMTAKSMQAFFIPGIVEPTLKMWRSFGG